MFSDATPVQEFEPIDAKKLTKVTEILKSIAHPLRISIIQLLSDGQPKMVTTIHRALNIEQAEASRQLGILKRTGILSASREGKKIWYELNKPQVLEMLQCIERSGMH